MEHSTNVSVYFSKYAVREPHSDYLFRVDYTVHFTNRDKKISKQIIDQDGKIIDFPGVEYTDRLRAELGTGSLSPIVRYEAIFERVDERSFIMVWTVRPDGSYWMDSWGFGGEDYESLSLYTYLDTEGNFLAPFRLYSVGYRFYGEYCLESERKWMKKTG